MAPKQRRKVHARAVISKGKEGEKLQTKKVGRMIDEKIRRKRD